VAFDPALGKSMDLSGEAVRRYPAAKDQWVEEVYTCDANGNVKVSIHNTLAQEGNEYRLGRWAKRASNAK
jgi:hypothetical protein